jgi:predicted peroxiredoxin/TusA-related sulfurtransferase
MSKIEAQKSIDMRRKHITNFILFNAWKKFKEMKDGEVLEIVTDDYPPIESDIKAWCRMTEHELIELQAGDITRYFIRKSESKGTGKKISWVISDPGLLELLSPLSFALGAALSGAEVSIYFQGPAVRVLKRGFKPRMKGMARPFSGFALKGMEAMGHVHPQMKVRQLRELGANIIMCGPSMDVFKVKKEELLFKDLIIGEYLTFVEIMSEADINFYA